MFPHGLLFALLSWVPGWIVQRLWWGLLLFIAFAGIIKLLECAGIGSRSSRIIAAILYALSPRILATLGAISSEAWVMAVAPWVLVPVVCAMRSTNRGYIRLMALASALAILALGAVNAVATAVVVVPAALWWLASFANPAERKTAAYFGAWWVPAGIAASFWWVGPLLVLGSYSPPFTDFIESAGLTTRWLNLLEVLRGTTSWTPFLSPEREGGFAQSTESVFIVGTLVVALIGLWGLKQRSLPYARRWLVIFFLGVLAMTLAVDPFSPLSSAYRNFLDGAGAPLRNLHKFDPLVRLAFVAGIAHSLRSLTWPGLSKQRWAQWRNPEANPTVVRCIATSLLIAIVTATAWSGRIPPADGFKAVPEYWQQTASWLNENATGVGDTQHQISRTMILPEARFARQTWGNTRDEPAQPLLEVPWVVRDSVPLVQPEAIRALDGVQRELESGAEIPTLAATLWNQGVGQVVIRTDLTKSANTPGATAILRTLHNSPGFEEVATFGEGEGGDGSMPAIQIFRITPPQMDSNAEATSATAGDLRVIDRDNAEVVAAGPEAMPRLAEADSALGRTEAPRTRVLASDNTETNDIQTVTDTPALRDHNYGNVVDADSEILATDDKSSLLNPVRDYPVGDLYPSASNDGITHVETTGAITASSSAADPTNFSGADTASGLNAAVDSDTSTAWRPANGVSSGQWMEVQLPAWKNRLQVEFQTQGAPARIQVTSLYREGESDPHSEADTEDAVRTSTTVTTTPDEPTTVKIPVGQANAVRLTILSAFGDVGISEVTLRDGRSGEDITPQRRITVPQPADANPTAVNRWVFGQEIPEGTMHRTFTVPERDAGLGVGQDGETHVVIGTPNCTDDSRPVPAKVIVDGDEHSCGDTVSLTAGEHSVSTTARWVSLTAAEPLLAEAVRNAPAATPLPVSGGSGAGPSGGDAQVNGDEYEIAAAPQERIIFAPSDANPGRIGTLESADGSTELQPITVNGWQQGWIVPAGASGTFSMSFAATGLYQGWLAAGLALAVLLVGVAVFSFRRHRGLIPLMRTERDAFYAAQRDESSGPGSFGTIVRWTLLGSFGLGTVIAARHPWGTSSYAGDYWLVTVAFAVSLLAVVVSHFRR